MIPQKLQNQSTVIIQEQFKFIQSEPVPHTPFTCSHSKPVKLYPNTRNTFKYKIQIQSLLLLAEPFKLLSSAVFLGTVYTESNQTAQEHTPDLSFRPTHLTVVKRLIFDGGVQ